MADRKRERARVCVARIYNNIMYVCSSPTDRRRHHHTSYYYYYYYYYNARAFISRAFSPGDESAAVVAVADDYMAARCVRDKPVDII